MAVVLLVVGAAGMVVRPVNAGPIVRTQMLDKSPMGVAVDTRTARAFITTSDANDNGSVSVRLAQSSGPQFPSNGATHGISIPEKNDDEFEWQIVVSDTGIGIPGDALNRIFERFYRVDKARSRSQGGTGLGLAIVKHIALAHGGSVHVESEPGKGSTFFIRLRARKVRSERVAAQN